MTLQLVLRNKTPLLIPTKEFRELVKRTNKASVLEEYSQGIAEMIHTHFLRDEIDLIDFNEAMSEGNYKFLGISKIGEKNLNMMNMEICSYRAFEKFITPLLGEYKDLRKTVGITDVLTNVMEADIKRARNALNSRVY